MSKRRHPVNLSSWFREGEGASWRVRFVHYGPDPVLGDICPCKILERHNYRLLFHIKYGIPALMFWKELKPYHQVCCENKCRTPVYCHFWPSMFSDLLAFALFMLSYSSFTYELTVSHHLFFSQDKQAKGIPDIWDFITVKNCGPDLHPTLA